MSILDIYLHITNRLLRFYPCYWFTDRMMRFMIIYYNHILSTASYILPSATVDADILILSVDQILNMILIQTPWI